MFAHLCLNSFELIGDLTFAAYLESGRHLGILKMSGSQLRFANPVIEELRSFVSYHSELYWTINPKQSESFGSLHHLCAGQPCID